MKKLNRALGLAVAITAALTAGSGYAMAQQSTAQFAGGLNTPQGALTTSARPAGMLHGTSECRSH